MVAAARSALLSGNHAVGTIHGPHGHSAHVSLMPALGQLMSLVDVAGQAIHLFSAF